LRTDDEEPEETADDLATLIVAVTRRIVPPREKTA
jgi:hypothetical protein